MRLPIWCSLFLVILFVFKSHVGCCGAPKPSRPYATLLLSEGNWSAIDDAGAFKEIGSSGSHEVMIEVEPVSPHLEIHFIGFEPDTPTGTVVPVMVTFEGGSTFSFTTTQIFNGVEAPNDLYAEIPDQQLAKWTHDFTDLPEMTVKIPGDDGSSWSFDLSGTTPTVTKMVNAMAAAGITDLPAPWNTSPSPSVSSNAAQNAEVPVVGSGSTTTKNADTINSGPSISQWQQEQDGVGTQKVFDCYREALSANTALMLIKLYMKQSGGTADQIVSSDYNGINDSDEISADLIQLADQFIDSGEPNYSAPLPNSVARVIGDEGLSYSLKGIAAYEFQSCMAEN